MKIFTISEQEINQLWAVLADRSVLTTHEYSEVHSEWACPCCNAHNFTLAGIEHKEGCSLVAAREIISQIIERGK